MNPQATEAFELSKRDLKLTIIDIFEKTDDKKEIGN